MNCAQFLPNILDNILTLSTTFDNIAVVFGYDKSNDDSLQILQDFKNTNASFSVHIIINTSVRHKYRTHNLEHIRNLILQFVLDNYDDYKYYITMDSDDVCSTSININVLQLHLNNSSKWDVLTFNKPNYYDIWALQYDSYVHHFRCLSYNSNQVINFVKDDITNKLSKLKSCEYFQVHSAFNGFGIYKLQCLKSPSVKYDGKTQQHFSDEKVNNMIEYLNANVTTKRKTISIHKNSTENCEHIGFHVSIINANPQVKIMITSDILFEDGLYGLNA
jgi:hypothetical protein